MRHTTWILGAVLPTLTFTANAQERASLDPTVVSKAAGVILQGGRLRAIGPRFVASFERGAIEFLPALGRHAPRPYPWRFTLESVRRGARVIHSARADALRHHDATSVRFERGVCVERYDVRPEGIEQSFVFAREVVGTGDLIVRGRLVTDLPMPQALQSRDGLVFAVDGVGGVELGAVTGVDAAGQTVRGGLRIDGDMLELSLPAAFVDRASYPLTLDPLIGGRFVVGGTAGDNLEPSVAWEPSEQRWLVVLRHDFSIGVSDLLGIRVLPDGRLTGSPIPISDPAFRSNERPSVGVLAGRDAFVVAWEAREFLGATGRIQARLVDARTGATGSVATLATCCAEHPDVAASRSGNSIVVWTEPARNRLRARTIDGGSGLAPVLGASKTLLTGGAFARPRIAQSDPASGRYFVVCEDGTLIRAVAVNKTLTAISGGLGFAAGTLSRPDVDGDGTEALVVWQGAESSGSRHDIRAIRLRFDGVNIRFASSTFDVEADAGDDEIEPAIALLGPKYVILWSDEAGSPNYDVGGMLLRRTDCVPCGVEFALVGPNRARQLRPQVGARRAAGIGDEALIVWMDADVTPPFQSNVAAQRFEALRGGTIEDFGGQCTGGGQTVAVGEYALGNPDFEWKLRGAAPSVAATALQIGLRGATPIVCGSCVVLSSIVTLPAAVSNGSASIPFIPSCDPRFIGLPLEFQWIVFPSGAADCPLAPGIAVSNRVRATLGS